jgi:hypothetical protein
MSFSEYVRDPQPTPEEHLQTLEQWEMLEDALPKLPVEMRQAIQLRKSMDYSLKEASGALGHVERALRFYIDQVGEAGIVSARGVEPGCETSRPWAWLNGDVTNGL